LSFAAAHAAVLRSIRAPRFDEGAARGNASNMARRFVRAGVAGCIGLLLTACATPSEEFARNASELGFHSAVLSGTGFRHAAYYAGIGERSDSLHVYIEHDGTPWIGSSHVSADPTPRSPFALELMARDAGPRLLLGRPCYFEMRHDAGCSALLWTHRRYAPEVVASMAAALREFLALHPFRHVMLIGYSGGGTLAWLIASRVPEASAVVTMAANLDVEAWTRLHDYSPLTGSLDPAREPPLSPAIRELHFAGGRDANVPPAVLRSFQARHPAAEIVDVPGFDHRCCWIDAWPRILDNAEMQLS
jgi:hypothetical protein